MRLVRTGQRMDDYPGRNPAVEGCLGPFGFLNAFVRELKSVVLVGSAMEWRIR